MHLLCGEEAHQGKELPTMPRTSKTLSKGMRMRNQESSFCKQKKTDKRIHILRGPPICSLLYTFEFVTPSRHHSNHVQFRTWSKKFGRL